MVANTLQTRLLVVLGALYLSQGLPSGILAHALPSLMRSWGVSLEWIGLLKLLALPWMFKFLWAPRFDCGHRIRGIIWMQGCSMLLLLSTACIAPPTSGQSFALLLLCAILFLLNVCSAIQDTATDGFAVKHLSTDALGAGNGLQVAGYKVGLLLGGSGLLMFVGHIGWAGSMLLQATIVLACSILVICYAPDKCVNSQAPGSIKSIWHIYQDFLSSPGIKPALCIVVIYKLGDSFGSSMIRPMLIDAGYSLADVGQLTLIASLLSLPAAWLGGLVFSRIGELRALILLGAFQLLGLLAWAWVVYATPGQSCVYFVAIFEQWTDVASTVALFAYMMRQCRTGSESGDYTALACFQAGLSGVVGALSGMFAAAFGYLWLLLMAAFLSLAALYCIPKLYGQAALDSNSSYV